MSDRQPASITVQALLVCAVGTFVILAGGVALAGAAGDTTVTLSPVETETEPGETITVEVVVDAADGGIGAQEINVTVGDTDVAEIVDAEPTGDPADAFTGADIAEDGSNVVITAATMDTPDTGSVVIARVDLKVKSAGEADMGLSVEALGDEEGNSYTVSETPGATVTGLGPIFDYSDLDVGPQSGAEPLTITAEAAVTNDGTAAGTTSVPLVVNGETVATQTVELDPGESETVSFERDLADPGEYDVTIGDLPAQTVTVTPEMDLTYTAFDVEPQEGSGTLTVTATATVENAGGAGTASVPLIVDGETVATETVDLDTGETVEMSFDYELDDPREYDVGIGDATPASVTVYEPPAIDAAADEQTVGVDDEVTFDVTRTGGTPAAELVEYQWDLTGDGEPDEITADPTLQHPFAKAGEYDVMVTVVDAVGATDSATVEVTVRAEPDASFRIDVDAHDEPDPDRAPDGDVEIGGEVTVNATDAAAQPGVVLRWDVALATEPVIEGEPVVTKTTEEPGEYDVTLVVEDDAGQRNTTTRTVVVADTTPPALDVDAPTETVVGTPITLDANGSVDNHDIAAYEWDLTGDGSIDATGPVVEEAFETAGTHEVTLTVRDASGNENETNVTVVAREPPRVTVDAPESGSFENESTVAVEYELAHTELETVSGVQYRVDGGDWTDADMVATTTPEQLGVDLEGLSEGEHTVTFRLVTADGETMQYETATDSATFTVDTTPPTVELAATPTNDDADAFVGPANPLAIEVNTTDANTDSTVVEIRNADGTPVFKRVVTDGAGDGEHLTLDWNATDADGALVENGAYEVVVTSTDAADNVETVSDSVTVDTTLPNVEITAVDGASGSGAVHANDDVSVTIETDDGRDSPGSVEDVVVVLESTFTTYTKSVTADQIDDSTWNVTVDATELPDEGEYTVRAIATDRARNVNDSVAGPTLVYDETSPRLSAVVEVAENDTGTVTVRSDQQLSDSPTVEVTLPDGDTVTVPVEPIPNAENRWTGEFDASQEGAYDVAVSGTDRAGNAGSDVTSANIQQVTTENGTVIVFNEDTGTFIEFNTDSKVDETFVSVSESDVPPAELDADILGIGFLTSQIGADLSSNLTNATIHVPVEDDSLPGTTSPDDVAISWYDAENGTWEAQPTTVETVSIDQNGRTLNGSYWTTTVDHFSTYGAVVEDDEAPELIDISTGDDQIRWNDDDVTVQFDYEDELSGVAVSSVELYVDGTEVTDDDSTSITSSSASQTLDIEPGESYEVTVVVGDEAGNAAEFETSVDVPEVPEPAVDAASIEDGTVLEADTETAQLTFDYTLGGSLDEDASELVVVANGETRMVDADFGDDAVTYDFDVEAGTSYEVELTLVDDLGKTSRTVTFTVAEEASDGEDGASGGGGGGGNTGGGGQAWDVRTAHLDDQVTIRFVDVPIAARMTADLEDRVSGSDVVIQQLDIDMTFGAPDFRIEIDHPSTNPDPAPQLDAASPIAYLDVRTYLLDTSALDKGRLHFTVDEAALPDDTEFEDVALYRYEDGSWSRLETKHKKDGAFVATTPGFSVFAIGVEHQTTTPTETASEQDSSDDSTTATPEEDDASAETEASSAKTETEDGIPGFGPVAALLALAIAIIAAIWTRPSSSE